MKNPFRLAFPRRAWAQVSWHPEARGVPTHAQVRAFDALAEVPGCRWEHCVIGVPKTVWHLDAWHEVLRLTDLAGEWREPARGPQIEAAPEHWLERRQGLWKPYDWQLEAAQKGLDAGHLLLCDDMGLGKTRSAILLAEQYRRHVLNPADSRPNIVIAPGFTVDVWRHELRATGAIGQGRDFCVLRTRNMDDKSFRKGCGWYFVHYDVVQAWASRLSLLAPVVAIIDEIHWIKNGRTQRAKGTAMAVGRAEMRIGLTGTPMSNRVDELWAPLSVLTGKNTWGGPIDFRKRYAGAIQGEFGYQDQGPTNVEELRERMEPYYLRRTLDDIDHDMPPLRRERISTPMSRMQEREHRQLARGYDPQELVDALVSGRAGTEALRTLMNLRKVTAAAKLKTTVSHVRSLLEQDQSVVVFCWQRETAEQIYNQFDDGSIAESRERLLVHGGFAQDVRDHNVNVFQYSRGPSLLVATYGVLREGVTLTKARAIVLHDLDWVPSNILQAEKRIHRLGQNAACMSYWVIAENSIDTILARLLTLKAEWIEETLGIDAPAKAANELQLEQLTGGYDAAEWARKKLREWCR